MDRDSSTTMSNQNEPDPESSRYSRRGQSYGLDDVETDELGNLNPTFGTGTQPTRAINPAVPTFMMGTPLRPEVNPSPSVNMNLQSSLGQDPVLDLGGNDWNTFMNATTSIGPDNMLGEQNALDPFSGFDIPFWFEQEQSFNMF